MIDELIEVLAHHYPFGAKDIKAVYLETVSLDTTIKILDLAALTEKSPMSILQSIRN